MRHAPLAAISALSAILAGCAHHPVDCAVGFAWADCLPGTAGYANGTGAQIEAAKLAAARAADKALADKTTTAQ